MTTTTTATTDKTITAYQAVASILASAELELNRKRENLARALRNLAKESTENADRIERGNHGALSADGVIIRKPSLTVVLEIESQVNEQYKLVLDLRRRAAALLPR